MPLTNGREKLNKRSRWIVSLTLRFSGRVRRRTCKWRLYVRDVVLLSVIRKGGGMVGVSPCFIMSCAHRASEPLFLCGIRF